MNDNGSILRITFCRNSWRFVCPIMRVLVNWLINLTCKMANFSLGNVIIISRIISSSLFEWHHDCDLNDGSNKYTWLIVCVSLLPDWLGVMNVAIRWARCRKHLGQYESTQASSFFHCAVVICSPYCRCLISCCITCIGRRRFCLVAWVLPLTLHYLCTVFRQTIETPPRTTHTQATVYSKPSYIIIISSIIMFGCENELSLEQLPFGLNPLAAKQHQVSMRFAGFQNQLNSHDGLGSTC